MEPTFSQKQLASSLVAAQFSLLGLIFLVPAAGERQIPEPFAIALSLLSIFIGGRALYDLRRSLRINPIPSETNSLASVGIYRWIRHPMYVSVLGLSFSSVLSNFTIWRFTLVAALLAVLLVKSAFEDRLLAEHHGQTALDYQQQTGAFIPKIKRP